MATIEPSPIADVIAARSGSAPLRRRQENVWAAARGGAGWVARADAAAGFVALAHGEGRADWLAEEFLATVAGALLNDGGDPEPPDSGPPAVAHAIISLLKAAHRELLAGGVADQGLETLVAIARRGRIHVIAAGRVACLRHRDGAIEMIAPVNQRERPPLGGSPRALIEVTSETLRSGDLYAVVPGGFELATDAGLAAEARETVARCAAWTARGGMRLDDEAWQSPCVALYVPPDHVAAPEDPYARVEIRNDAAKATAPPAATALAATDPGGEFELPSWLAEPALEAEATADPGAAAGPRRPAFSVRRPSVLSARNVGLALAAIGVAILLLMAGRIVRDHRQAASPAPLITAGAANPVPAGGGLGALAAGSGSAESAAPGSLSALTEPFVPGVQVFIDERPVGAAPAVVEGVAPGRHRVRFSGPGGFSWEEEILVRAGEASQVLARTGDVEEVTLVTVQATVMSERGLTEKSGLIVFVDGAEEGETPLDVELDPGVHAITIQRAAGPSIHRVLDVRRGDRLILNVNLDDLPAITLEHTPPAHWKAGDSPVLTVVREGLDSRASQPVHLHMEVNERWQDLVMAPIPGAPGTHAVGVPLPETSGKAIRYYFSTVSDGGEEVFSAVYVARVR